MPSLIHAFDQFRREGLIAPLECYCEHCGEQQLLAEAQEWRRQNRVIRGFAHVGAFDPFVASEEARIPILFGWTDGKAVSRTSPDCAEVGRIVSACLDEHKIRYEWDRLPGTPILVNAEDVLEGLPEPGHVHSALTGEDKEVYSAPIFPESAFDMVAENPVRLLNIAKVRQLQLDVPHLRGPLWYPLVGDRVTLGFRVWDAVAPLALAEIDGALGRYQLESMTVEVTSFQGERAARLYRGELLNAPVLIAPAKLRLGSPITFTAEQVFPSKKPARRQMVH